jgi:hypothetical protein
VTMMMKTKTETAMNLEDNNQELKTHKPTIRELKGEAKARMIKKLFALGYSRGFDKMWHLHERGLTPSKRVANHLNEWFTTQKESPVKKAFSDMTGPELQKAITVFEKIGHWHLQQINKAEL